MKYLHREQTYTTSTTPNARMGRNTFLRQTQTSTSALNQAAAGRKIIKKPDTDTAMKAISILIAITALFLSSTSRSESRPTIRNEENNFCGYNISGKTFERIENIESTTNNGIQKNKITTTIKTGRNLIKTDIEISCHTTSSPATTEPRGAKSEIELEDSGGRYYRIVNWEKVVQGKNWLGTMAYVNSIFGDGENSAIPNQFLACPKLAPNPCFYIHIATPTKLSKRDSTQIINSMKDISIKP